MIERKFVAEKMREFLVHDYFLKEMGAGKFSSFEIKRTPLGDKIVVYTARPGLIVGKKGENIKKLTKVLKSKFKMENPQIEVAEISNPNLDAQTMAEQIVNVLERFGPKRFKSVGYKTLQRIIDAGAVGAEIVISGRGLPGSRAKTWRFYSGYLKKSGDVAMSLMDYGLCVANLKSGSIGIKVKILPPDVELPDKIEILKRKKKEIIVEVKEGAEEVAPVKKEEKKEVKKKVKKKAVKKKVKKEVKKESEVKKEEKVENENKK
ncbi:30S ribosomal protein S3 [archaeon]|jgi:small subunit ribosomal protein S3|nr:30S ribosomal protein S3 [archaeon]MBT3730909.1 30S ribosomal protein S3 [archaeon]MBT4669852.1 30S ribosomal protein S3 [archaeon]MBT5030004.1 30S ribosomal protein S3 [archaeon]MBT5288105.1 30S ribosomal protein S3 [archaeon]